MAITLGSNIASEKTQRALLQSISTLSEVFARLSSGQRINRSSDDAAGLAISESLNADRRVYTQGVRNLNDGISALNIAEGAMKEITGIVIRIKELATQSANGFLSHEQRESLDDEAQALSKEYLRIIQSSKFNGQALFDGSFSELRVQGGYGLDGGVASTLGGVMGDGSFDGAVSFETEPNYSLSTALGDLNMDGVLDLITAGYADSFNSYATIRLGLGDGSFGAARSYLSESYYPKSITLGDLNGDGVLDLITAGGNIDDSNGYATIRLGLGDGSFGAARSYVTESGCSYSTALGDLNGDGVLDLITAGQSVDSWNSYATIRLGLGDGSFGAARSYVMESNSSSSSSYSTALGDLNGDGVLDLITAGYYSDDYDGYTTIRLGLGDGSFGAARSYVTESYCSYSTALGDLNGDGVLDLITAGRADGNDGYATVRLGSTRSGAAPLLPFSLRTEADSKWAMSLMDQKLEHLAIQQGTIGAFQSRLSTAINNLQATIENYAAASGGITDADVAHESARLVRQQILQQAGASILAQANQQPALALKLLVNNTS